ncbi:MAG: GxxExxY protein [Ignavibacteria bacterium]|nr:GxxExxY protein [Ignavibacteria bacterium]
MEPLSHEEKLSQLEEEIATKIVDAAYNVHKNLGPGLLEKIYEVCFCHELAKRNLKFKTQVNLPVIYDNIKFETGFRLEVMVEEIVICELKAATENISIWNAQLLSHLKLSKRRLGFIINFNVPVIKNGIKRIVL